MISPDEEEACLGSVERLAARLAMCPVCDDDVQIPISKLSKGAIVVCHQCKNAFVLGDTYPPVLLRIHKRKEIALDD
ncbi:MAG: hypothetical protein AAB800_01360 [Patescibacteria group bacterium]